MRLLQNAAEQVSFFLDYRTTPVGGGTQKILSLSTNDLLELQIQNTTDGTNVTVPDGTIAIITA